MSAAQMLSYCSSAMEIAVGDKVLPRMFIGRLIGRFVTSSFRNDKPLRKNGPTAPTLIITDDRNLETERTRVLRFSVWAERMYARASFLWTSDGRRME